MTLNEKRSLKTFYYIILWTIIVLINSGCNKEDDILNATMKDGNHFTVSSKIKFYETEEAFLHSVSFFSIEENITNKKQNIEYKVDSIYSILSYDQIFTGSWEIAKFGTWISQYGLTPNTTYYVATDIYTKYLPAIPEELMIVPSFVNKEMGFCPGTSSRTFISTNKNEANICVLQTGNKSIKYDSNGNSINLSINNLNEQLKWKFQIQKNVWD